MPKITETYKYLLAFGSNVGDRQKNLIKSIKLLEKYLCVTKQTLWQETKPLKHPDYFTDDHDNYLNFVCEAESTYKPDELYKIIKTIEDDIGHPREKRWMPRSLDIDILFCVKSEKKAFSQCQPFPFEQVPNFSVPHKEYYNRSFWRDMVEKELNIPEEFLAKHFNCD